MKEQIKPRILPQSLEAEQAVLGSLLTDKDISATVFASLTAKDFYSEAHALIFDAMNELFLNNQPIDYVTLSNILTSKGLLEKTGDLEYITTLTTILPSAANYLNYVNIVKEKSILRKLIKAGQNIVNVSFEESDYKNAIAVAEKEVFDISKEQDISTLQELSSALSEVINKFETIHNNPESLIGLQTGFAKLDKLTNGLQKGDLILLAARPGVGKTSLAMNIATNVALDGKKVAIFSLEMPRVQLAQRCLCSVAFVPMENALSGKLTSKEWSALIEAKQRLNEARMFVDDNSLTTPQEILSKCRRLQREHGLDLIVIDYLQLMSIVGKHSDSSRQNEVAEISRMLKIIAKELNIPVLVLSQMSRQIESRKNHEPQLSDLRESGAIEQDADIVMFIDRKEMYADTEVTGADKDKVELIIAKHRNGPQGRIDLKWIGSICSYKSVNFDANMASIEASAPKQKRRNDDPTDDDVPPENPMEMIENIFE